MTALEIVSNVLHHDEMSVLDGDLDMFRSAFDTSVLALTNINSRHTSPSWLTSTVHINKRPLKSVSLSESFTFLSIHVLGRLFLWQLCMMLGE